MKHDRILISFAIVEIITFFYSGVKFIFYIMKERKNFGNIRNNEIKMLKEVHLNEQRQ